VNINYEFVSILNKKGGEGSTLYSAGMGSGPHLQYKIDWLRRNNPKRILETGTNKAQFCYVVKLLFPECHITTFDIHEWCQGHVNMVLEETNTKDIHFILGDTLETLTNFDGDFDCAWVDGGHSYEVCMSDLKQCERMKIPNLLIDDWVFCPEVKRAVIDFVENSDYEIVGESLDSPGIVEIVLVNEHDDS